MIISPLRWWRYRLVGSGQGTVQNDGRAPSEGCDLDATPFLHSAFLFRYGQNLTLAYNPVAPIQ